MSDLWGLQSKTSADGKCGVYGDRVPRESLNKFYCLSRDCLYTARKYFDDLEAQKAQEKYGDDE
jgi:hypothetical protein